MHLSSDAGIDDIRRELAELRLAVEDLKGRINWLASTPSARRPAQYRASRVSYDTLPEEPF